tara:strand:- start:304 stop:1017 length:714 start_codon:yes stop_codon:yes gene_type:complete
MNKTLITGFVNKYALGSSVESVTWTVKDKLLSTAFKTPDKTCRGTVTARNVDLPDAEIGIFNTDQLMRMLAILDDTIIVDIRKQKGVPVALDISDNNTTTGYVLAQLDVIPNPGKLKMIPTFVCNIAIDDGFCNRFLKAKGALPDCNYFTITKDDMSAELTFGYSDINSNTISYSIVATSTEDVDVIHFSSDTMRDILTANRGIPGQIEISPVGLMRVTFTTSVYSAEYYLVSKQID